MQKQWEAAQAGLQEFLKEDDKYANFLESIEQELERKMRFGRRSRCGSLVESVAFDRFVQSAAQLRHIHVLFQEKLKPIAEPLSRINFALVNEKCDDLMNIMTDMLHVLRLLYGQLICRSKATHVTLETSLSKEDKEWDGEILENYLEARHLTVEKLVSRPLSRFYELVEFVEALSNTLSEDGIDEVESNDSDVGNEERLNYAPQLMHIVQKNKHYIHLAKTKAREEKELIALQTCFYGDGADIFNDLSRNTLLLHGEVFVMNLRDQRVSSGVGPEAAINTDLFSHSKKVHAHCFQDGTFVCSRRQNTELGVSFVILHHIQLKQDAVFLELIPISIPVLGDSEEASALALISQDTTLVFAWKDVMDRQRWADNIGGFLEMNGSRTEVLHQSRTIDELPIREDILAQLVENDTIPTKFASFCDDHLPGVFWMAPCEGSNLAPWELVEVVFCARWLLVLRMEGWKKHSALYNFDTHSPGMEISEHLHADKVWSLVVSNGSVDVISLVSMKRTRIDFWYDQVWKAVESAKVLSRREEKEKVECLVTKDEEIYTQRDSRKKAVLFEKKRKISDNNDTSIALANEKEQSKQNCSSSGGCESKPDDNTDKECGELDRGSMTVSVREQQTAAPPAKKSKCSSDKRQNQISGMARTEENGIFAAISLAIVKAPKKKRLKRKSNDTALVPTQASPSESTSEIDTTQVPANEEPTENEPKPKEVRVILTGIEITASIRKKIRLIGAVYEGDVERATHILAPYGQLKRTVKLLCGISRCAHVLDVRWLEESARVGAPINERAHCLKDARAETKWHFDLRKTMYDFTPEQRQQLFAGHQIFITSHKSMLPPVNDLVKIVECAGGTAVTKGSAGPGDVVITSEPALTTASVRKALTLANPQRIYSSELILSSILQQYLDFGKNRLSQTSDRSRRCK